MLQDKPGFDKLISAKDIRGATALHHAAQFGQKKVCFTQHCIHLFFPIGILVLLV